MTKKQEGPVNKWQANNYEVNEHRLLLESDYYEETDHRQFGLGGATFKITVNNKTNYIQANGNISIVLKAHIFQGLDQNLNDIKKNMVEQGYRALLEQVEDYKANALLAGYNLEGVN